MSKSFMILIVAFMAVLQLVVCQELAQKLDEANKNDLNEDGDSSALSASKAGLVPIVVLRGQNDNPDFFLVWWKPYEQYIPKPMMDIINSQVRPQTQQISGQIIDGVPFAEQAWSQISQLQNLIGQLGLTNMVGGNSGGSSGDNPLSGLFGRRRR